MKYLVQFILDFFEFCPRIMLLQNSVSPLDPRSVRIRIFRCEVGVQQESKRVCVWTQTHLHEYKYIYVYLHMCIHIFMYFLYVLSGVKEGSSERTSACAPEHKPTHMYTCTYIYIYRCVYKHLCIVFMKQYIIVYIYENLWNDVYVHMYLYIWLYMFIYICVYLHIHVSLYTYICITHLFDCTSLVLSSLPPVFHGRQHFLDRLRTQNLQDEFVWCPRRRIRHHCQKQYNHPRTSCTLRFNVMDGCRHGPQELVHTVEPAPDIKIFNVGLEVIELLFRFTCCVFFDLDKLGAVLVYLYKDIQVWTNMYVHNYIHMKVREYIYTYIHTRIYTIFSRCARLRMRRSNIEAAYANRVVGNNVNMADFPLIRDLKRAQTYLWAFTNLESFRASSTMSSISLILIKSLINRSQQWATQPM